MTACFNVHLTLLEQALAVVFLFVCLFVWLCEMRALCIGKMK